MKSTPGDFVRVELCKGTLRDVSAMKYIYARRSKYGNTGYGCGLIPLNEQGSRPH